jgi:hypothetical protein
VERILFSETCRLILFIQHTSIQTVDGQFQLSLPIADLPSRTSLLILEIYLFIEACGFFFAFPKLFC